MDSQEQAIPGDARYMGSRRIDASRQGTSPYRSSPSQPPRIVGRQAGIGSLHSSYLHRGSLDFCFADALDIVSCRFGTATKVESNVDLFRSHSIQQPGQAPSRSGKLHVTHAEAVSHNGSAYFTQTNFQACGDPSTSIPRGAHSQPASYRDSTIDGG